MAEQSVENAKRAAALAAMEYILPGMRVGLGTGSTTKYFLEELGRRCREGLQIQAVASSLATERHAKELGIPLLKEGLTDQLDIAVDGADEVDSQKRLIKGGGGALLREKIIAYHANSMIVIIDEGKLSKQLGKALLPVEIIPFGHQATEKAVKALGISTRLRLNQEKKPFITDNGNFILDLDVSALSKELEALTNRLYYIPGVIETGLFVNLASAVLVGKGDRSVYLF